MAARGGHVRAFCRASLWWRTAKANLCRVHYFLVHGRPACLSCALALLCAPLVAGGKEHICRVPDRLQVFDTRQITIFGSDQMGMVLTFFLALDMSLKLMLVR